MQLLNQLIEERAEIGETQTSIVTRAAEEARDLTETEDKNLTELQKRSLTVDARIVELRTIKERNLAAELMKAEVKAMGGQEIAPKSVGGAIVRNEPLTYSENRSDTSFFSDMFAAHILKNRNAEDRINRHQQEMAIETRAGDTGSFAGLVVPQFLTSLAANFSRAGRPFADQCRSLSLPDSGMTLNISRVTTGATAAVQATENSAVSNTSIDDTLLTSTIATVASAQQISRQAMERGTGVDELIVSDMGGAMATVLDNQLINGSGSSGQLLGISQVSGINSVTYNDASPTVAELYPKLLDAIQQINTGIFRAPDLIIMHPRRAASISAAVDTTGRPIVLPIANVPQNAMGTGPAAGYGNTGLQIAGIPIVTDANVRTDLGAGTEDAIYVVSRGDMLLFENGGPMFMRMEETAGLNLTLSLVAYSYVGFVPGRYPAAISAITGSGLISPTF
jgi:HK97 family phage major capsid protein